MDESAAQSPPPEAPPARPTGTPRWGVPRLPLLIGVIGLGAVVATGSWVKRRGDARAQIEAQALRGEATKLQSALGEYRVRFENLRWNAAKLRANANATPAEPLKSWTRERAMRMEALVTEIQQKEEEEALLRLPDEVEALCRKGDVVAARQRLARAPVLRFPSPAEFQELHARHYTAPLAQFSRQNPDYYRAFLEHEPVAAQADIAALRAQLASAGMDVITPQTMLGYELLGAVAPGDPLVADWSTVVTAEDFFEKPDTATLARWRRAQQAVRADDWPTAVAQMQSIHRSTVRTRQPFRAAYGRAILRASPDRGDEAYPFLQEAALAGDKDARVWLSAEDLAKGRNAAALRWLEARVADGEAAAIAPLLSLYALPREALPRDREQETGVLQTITDSADAPALAWMLLARLYDSGTDPEKENKAFACYQRAAEKGHEPAWIEVARRHLRGTGTPVSVESAAEWACRAFAAGEREQSVPMLIELMQRAPERSSGAVQELFEHEQTATAAGFNDERIQVGGVSQLQTLLARYFDRRGLYGRAARLYESSGNRDPSVMARHAELTKVHPCQTCAGAGKTQSSVACPTCSGKGTVLCSACDGRGYNLIPGSPPCTTCGGSGGIVQDGRAVACNTCNGTGKGKDSVTKQPCAQCVSGRMPCRACTGGRIKVTKECPACHGSGSRSLADS